MKQHFEKQLDEMVLADVQSRPYTVCFSADSLKHYPARLYKYRDCHKEHNFTMIEEGYLWADNPANFYNHNFPGSLGTISAGGIHKPLLCFQISLQGKLWL